MRSLVLILAALPVLTEPAGPRVIERTAPDYTDEARLARLQGSALVSLVVAEDATLRDVHITRPIGLGLDEKAVAAVKDWQFSPATEGERPVLAVARVEVNFRLLMGRDDWHLSRATFEVPPGASRPVLISAEYPDPDKSAGCAVTVTFSVDAQGVPADIDVEKSSDEKSAVQVEQFVRGWRFRPALAGGRPVRSRGTLIFARGQTVGSE